nr:type II methionyl aminopeptidase [Candidatus Bathyarchaeota archaeon]
MKKEDFLEGIPLVKNEEDVIEAYRAAGRILEKALNEGKRLAKPDVLIIELCEAVEEKILSEGGELAFPCNVSVNDVAAHYTSPPGDETRIPREAIVKIDAGAHVDGYIVDKAISVSTSAKWRRLVHATEEALKKALKEVKPNVPVKVLGKTIEKVIRSFGFNPVVNLSGHQIERYTLHAGKSIPNFNARHALSRIRRGEVYAIEPFATNGVGLVMATGKAYIYRIVNPKEVPPLLRDILERYNSLPFAVRWVRDIRRKRAIQVLRYLTKKGVLAAYPILVEKSRGWVAQSETTVLVTENACEVF